jgi:ketosteroid isomerase-like protein
VVRRLVALICLGLAVSACGGDDRDEAKQTVRDFVKAVNERDGETYCDELITEEFREKSTFAKGDKASESCRRQLEAIKGLRIRLVRIVKTEVDGDTATVTAVLGRSGQQGRQELLLEKEDGDWKLAGGGAGQ